MFETFYNDPISYSVIMTVLSGLALLFFLPILFGCIFFYWRKSKVLLRVFTGLFLILTLFIVFGSVPFYYWAKAGNSENHKVAIANYDKAMTFAIFPEYKSLLYMDKFKRYMAMGCGKEAIENYEKALSYHKSYSEPQKGYHLFAAMLYTRAEDYDKAIEIYKKYNDYIALSGVYRMMGDYKTALEYATQAVVMPRVSSNPHRSAASYKSEAYHNRAIIYRHLGQDDLAQKDLQMAIKLNPRNKDSYLEKYEQYELYEKRYLEQHKLARRNYHFTD